MDCKDCERSAAQVPFAVHESDMARLQNAADQEREILNKANRRWVIAFWVMLVLFVGSNALWIYYESQFSVTETETSTESEQETDGGGNNYIVGGDYNGDATSKNNDENEDPNP